MICSCDKAYASKYSPNSIHEGVWLKTQERIQVTLGFQNKICPECRGEEAIAAPINPLPGANSKIKRYYWREIYMETTKRFYDKYNHLDPTVFNEFDMPEERKVIENQVVKSIKALHAKSPKYTYDELSQSEVISKTNTEVILEIKEYSETSNRKVGIKHKDKTLTVEEFASEYFKDLGYQVLFVESRPFHVLFGIFMCLIIHDSNDTKNEFVQFGSRSDYENGEETVGQIMTLIPSDFGTSGYFLRRKNEIRSHLEEILLNAKEPEDLNFYFDLWIGHSYELRQYLWAHREKDIETARKVMHVIKAEGLIRVLKYLSLDYWKNFCGWPDLLVFNSRDFFFVEVKSSKDKLSEDQKNWFIGNDAHMKFKAKIFKIAKSNNQC
jgi:hypothetical protein